MIKEIRIQNTDLSSQYYIGQEEDKSHPLEQIDSSKREDISEEQIQKKQAKELLFDHSNYVLLLLKKVLYHPIF